MLTYKKRILIPFVVLLLTVGAIQAAASSSSAAASSQEAFNALKETYLKAIENNDIEYAKQLYEELQEIDPAQAGQLHPESPSFGKQSPLPSGASHSAAASGASSSSAAASSSSSDDMITLQAHDGHTVILPANIATTYSQTLASLLSPEVIKMFKQSDKPIQLRELTGKQLELVAQLMMEADRLSRLGITDQPLITQLADFINLDELIIPQTFAEIDISQLSPAILLKLAAFMNTRGKSTPEQELPEWLKQEYIDKQLIYLISEALLFLQTPLLLEVVIQAFINNIEQTETKRKAIIARKKNSLLILSETAQSMLYAYNIRLKPDGYSIRELSDKGVPLSNDMSNMPINSFDGIELLPNRNVRYTGHSIIHSAINLSNTNIDHVPAYIEGLENLQILNLSNNNITTIPTHIEGLGSLFSLDLNNNNITTIPTDIKGLPHLRFLYLKNNNITTIPTDIKGLPHLQVLDLSNNSITTIPTDIKWLGRLYYLNLSNNNITEIPIDIKRLPHLQELDLRGNPIQATPKERAQLQKSLRNTRISWPD